MTNVNEDRPLVTVAMVTYNSEKYLQKAIESVLCQSYANLELVIGDDCSKDSTWEIINSYAQKDSRIKIYRNENNLTQYPNRNKALNMASGKYIIYIDGDDIIYPHGLEFMVRMLEGFPDCGMALMYWYRNNLIWPVILSSYNFFLAEYFHQGFIPTSLSKVLFNTSRLKEIGGFPTKHVSSDILVRHYVALKYPSVIINDNVTWWRETPGQQSLKVGNTLKGLIEWYQQRDEILKNPACPFNEKEKEEGYQNINRVIFFTVIKSMIKLRFSTVRKLWPYFKWDLGHFSRKKIVRDPFGEFTPANPYVLDFKEHPFHVSRAVK